MKKLASGITMKLAFFAFVAAAIGTQAHLLGYSATDTSAAAELPEVCTILIVDSQDNYIEEILVEKNGTIESAGLDLPTSEEDTSAPGNATFMGWGESAELNIFGDEPPILIGQLLKNTIVTQNLHVRALWYRTVEFVSPDKTVTYHGAPNTAMTLPTAEYSTTYSPQEQSPHGTDAVISRKIIFDSWHVTSPSGDLVGAAGEQFTPEKETNRVYAAWKDEGNPFTVTIHVGDENTIVYPDVYPHAVIERLPTVTQEGRRLSGWFDAPDGQGERWGDELGAGIPQKELMKTINLYPFFEGGHSLTVVVPEGGSLESNVGGIYADGSSVELKLKVENGYHFEGWSALPDAVFADSKQPQTTVTMPTEDVIITAHIKPIPTGGGGDDGGDGGDGGGDGGGGGDDGGGGGDEYREPPKATPHVVTYNLSSQGEQGKISSKTMRTIIEANRENDVAIKNLDSNVVFNFAGGTMKEIPGVKDYDFGVEVGNSVNHATIAELAGDTMVNTIKYKYEGQLPAKANIDILMGEQYAGVELYYYYFEPVEKTLTLMQTSKVNDMGWLRVEQTHCSEYVLANVDIHNKNAADAIKSPPPPAKVQQPLPDSGVRENKLIMVTVGALLLCASGWSFGKFRDELDKEEDGKAGK